MMIAICGQPHSGKSEVQKILADEFNILPFDDGAIARKNCMDLFGLSHDDVHTQQGKKRITNILGVDWEHRKVLGEYLQALEDKFGEHVVPQWAWREAQKALNKGRFAGASFGSVRKTQGWYFRNQGGVVLEVVRPSVGVSDNIWDQYDPTAVTHSLLNNTDSIDALKKSVSDIYDEILGEEKKIAA